ncbi:unnamed protein product [Ceratitis capitata]|uniref:(Mediterranean fruit fly) hypothetical protein n=1 Tax=Ceratitis capitata TaxID=7213 RepID=A0A811UJ34_CERCA|nr:unnamed protein product [Ceratitis capitata]
MDFFSLEFPYLNPFITTPIKYPDITDTNLQSPTVELTCRQATITNTNSSYLTRRHTAWKHSVHFVKLKFDKSQQ